MRRWRRLAGLGFMLLAAGTGVARPQEATPGAPTALPLVVEDFEASPLGVLPLAWTRMQSGTRFAAVTVERAPEAADLENRGLVFVYDFEDMPTPARWIEVGAGGRLLPGSVRQLSLLVFGDRSKNSLGLRVRDRDGETFEWRRPVDFSGWRQVEIPLDGTGAERAGTGGNGRLDPPLRLDGIRLIREADGAPRGEILLDDVSVTARFQEVRTLFDQASDHPGERWIAIPRHATTALVSDAGAPREGQEVCVVSAQYEFETTGDAQVELVRPTPLGPGHGTLMAEVFGDGSSNLLRFRLRDANGRLWQADWAGRVIDWSGWKTTYVDTRTLVPVEGPAPPGGPALPLELFSLVLDDASPEDGLPGVESARRGEVFLGKVTFGEELRS